MDLVKEDILDRLSQKYPFWYTSNRLNSLKKDIGKEIYGCDCSGLIKSYLFGGLNHPNYIELYDLNSTTLFELSQEKGDISTLPEIPGICLYMKGHVGIYSGDGKVIECTKHDEFGDGVVETNILQRDWTSWFYCPFISYNE